MRTLTRTIIVYFFLAAICGTSLAGFSQTDNPVTLGGVTSNNQLRIQVFSQGRFNVTRYIAGSWVRHFFDQSTTPLFAIKIGTTTYSSGGTQLAVLGGLITGAGPLTAFNSIQDVGTPVTVGTDHEVTKQFTGTYNGNTFSVTIKIMYSTSTPQIIIKHATIDASNIPAGTPISLAYGFDTFLAGNDEGFAYILPNIFGLNDNPATTNRYLTTAQVRSLRMLGARNGVSRNTVIAYSPMDKPFDKAWSSYPPATGYAYNILALQPGNGTNVGTDLQYKVQFGTYSNSPAPDNGQGVGYDSIPAGEITEIKTALYFVSAINGEVDYFWNNSKNCVINIGDSVCLDLTYLNHSNVVVNNVGFRVTYPGLNNLTGTYTSSGFTGGTHDCTLGNDFYQLSSASVAASGTAAVSIPINASRAGQWVINAGSISNTSQTLPFGSQAVLTVGTTVSLVDTSTATVCSGRNTYSFSVKFADTVVAMENVTVYISYSGNTSDFASLPSSVVIPAGQNSAAFTVVASPSALVGSITLTLSGTDKAFATVTSPLSAAVDFVNSVPHSASIVVSDTNVCPKTSVTFTASSTNSGDSPSYQWKKNGINVGTNSATYTDVSFANGDVIICEVTANDACAGPLTAVSNSIIMKVRPATPPIIRIETH